MDTAPALTVGSLVVTTSEEPPFVDRVAGKVHQLAAVKPALVRLLEWQIDEALKAKP